MSERIIVIGGGIAGLSAAWRLQQQQASAHVLILEATSRAGGTLQSEVRDGFLLEHGADCFITEKPAALDLCRELGLERELLGSRMEFRRSFIARGKTLYPVPEGFYLMGPRALRPFLETPLLSWRGKWRALLEPLLPPRKNAGDESLASFVRRRFGAQMLENFAQPLIGGIYGADPETLSLRATFPKFQDMEIKYGSVLLGLKKSKKEAASGARYGLFRTLRGGLQRLTNVLAARVNVRYNAAVTYLSHDPTGWTVTLSTGEKCTADAVILALPSYASATLVDPLDAALASSLRAIAYSPAVTLNAAFRELDLGPLPKGAGFVVRAREKKRTIGCTFAHQKFEGRVPKGFALLRSFAGGTGAAWQNDSNAKLEADLLAELHDWVPFKGKPLFTRLIRYEHALPLFAVGHVERVAQLEEQALRHKGLALAGNWAYGVGIPDCIASGYRAADVSLRAV